MKGYAGQYLDINLSCGQIKWCELDEQMARDYVGGYGFVARTLLDMPSGVDALAPENVLSLWVGPFAGTIIPVSSKFAVGAKSPLTGAFGFGICSGTFGAELRRAGYDGIIFRGKAERPTVCFIDDEKVCLLAAEEVWGKDAWETEDEVKQMLGDSSIKVAAIGPAGECMNRLACINNEKHRQVGRTGMGAVMGSKNLKAVAVRGSGSPQVHDLEGLLAKSKILIKRCQTDVTQKYRLYGTPANILVHNKLGCLPTRNFQQATFEHADAISGQTMLKTKVKKVQSCEACPIACDHVNVVEKGKYKGSVASVDYESLWAYGSNCGVKDLDAITKAVEYSDRLGFDTISGGMIVSWAMECYENGILTKEDTDGLDLKFGNADAMVEATRKMGLREGKLGDLLAEGAKRAADKIGKDAYKYAIVNKGMEWAAYAMRSLQTSTLGVSVSVRGACYLRSGSYSLDVGRKVDPFMLDAARGPKVKSGEDLYALIDSLIICKFSRNIYETNEEIAEVFNLVTGLNMTIEELIKSGERILNASKLFNLRQGFGRQDDYPPYRAFHEELTDQTVVEQKKAMHDDRLLVEAKAAGKAAPKMTKGAVISKEEYDIALDSYYASRGWDQEGVPGKEKLKELRLE
ncbi:MAG TPA: hypothetical protein ENN77_01040, partial [Candidatus Wirthbacteria bacterium]|nr:hypothetical protein [Candidatus Wirthbacteria bacterium]